MGKTTRRKFTPEFKAKVALETLKESSTKDDLAKKYEISPEMISRWKKNSWMSNTINAQPWECARWWIISKAKDIMSGRNL